MIDAVILHCKGIMFWIYEDFSFHKVLLYHGSVVFTEFGDRKKMEKKISFAELSFSSLQQITYWCIKNFTQKGMYQIVID